MTIERIDTKSEHLNIYDDKIIDFIYNFENGVRSLNKDLGVVQNSINLAIISTNLDDIKIELSARSMANDELAQIKDETIKMLEAHNFDITTDGKYPAWKPDINEFTNKVLEIYKEVNPKASLEAIHAGLECAIFKDKYPHIKVASIGPSIEFPHSKKERVSKKSVENVFEVVKKIVEELNK
jgi:dipeptidase D